LILATPPLLLPAFIALAFHASAIISFTDSHFLRHGQPATAMLTPLRQPCRYYYAITID
jgi:hypothetical protein